MSNYVNNPVESLTQNIVPTERQEATHVLVDPVGVRVRAILFMAAVIIAEVIIVLMGVLPGTLIHGLLLVSLINFYYFTKPIEERRIYLALALLPLLRILSIAMPNPMIAQVFWYVMIGLPLFIATIWVSGINDLPHLRLDIPALKWLSQIMIGLSGIPLGVIAAIFLKPKIDTGNQLEWSWFVFQVVVVTLFGAVVEELIFRGLIQKALSIHFGVLSIVFSSILYASMFLGTLSPNFILLYGISGLLFSVWVKLTDSLWGVIIAHSLMNIVFMFITRVWTF